ncbi:DUF7288 family protein [Methanofollis tationis]|uniref:Uncharacterized protein n=1 Tax=Methanofollis tationis TaxID=81417 RepID=A0A7K4HNX4_9EURY|nr:hypothetical protein [Methanofollis tationis]NVO66757.1 hypothetical protein [Methanofollis tationis]
MVDDAAQLYTMEGIAAAFVILATVYLVAGTTSIYTPGDSHITDMQLEVLGNDVLLVMDTPVDESSKSDLVTYIENWDDTGFESEFKTLLNNRTAGTDDTLQFAASVSYRKADGTVKNGDFVSSERPTGYEQAVRVTRLVSVDYSSGKPAGAPGEMRSEKQVVMLEVLIWRD